MPQIVPKRNRFRQVFVEHKRARDRARNLSHVECMRQARDVMVPFGRAKHLRFVLQTLERVAVYDTIPIPLEFRTETAQLFRSLATFR